MSISRSREGAWIEMTEHKDEDKCHQVAPVRERGLKYEAITEVFRPFGRSREGAWIEISVPLLETACTRVAPVRERGLKCRLQCQPRALHPSLP